MNQLKIINKFHPKTLIKIKCFTVLNPISKIALSTYTSHCGEGCSQNLSNVTRQQRNCCIILIYTLI